MSDNSLANIEETQPTNVTASTSSENKDKRKVEGAQPNTNAHATDGHTTNSTRKADTNTHTEERQTG